MPITRATRLSASAASLAVLRRPTLLEKWPSGDLSFDVFLDNIQIEEIRVDEPVFGQAATFTGSLSLAIDDESLEGLNVELMRTDSDADRLVATYRPDENYALNLDAASALAAHLYEHGSDSIVVAGSTGESPTLTNKEKLDLFRAVIETARGKGKVVAGTGTYDTAETLELSREAERLGADDEARCAVGPKSGDGADHPALVDLDRCQRRAACRAHRSRPYRRTAGE